MPPTQAWRPPAESHTAPPTQPWSPPAESNTAPPTQPWTPPAESNTPLPSAYTPPVEGHTPPAQPWLPPGGAYPPIHDSLGAPAPYAPPPGYMPPQAGFQPRLVSPGGRLGAQILDGVLIFVTAGIGWLIWALIVFDGGLTPARQILGHVVVDAATGTPLSWGRMAVRELLLKGVLAYVAGAVTFGVYYLIDSLMVFGQRYQTLHDRMAGTVVVHR
ncbi:RDD family protein [Actinoplanes sp. HUAS TT8]|uniref:RDD family protein n=1 Tax=Actinoplanes sp. HUAS TT8 TaxID=3447453 RepID=UPI003F51B4E7